MKNHGSHNSLEEKTFYMSLIESLIEHDCVDLWSSDKNRERDLVEIRDRFLSEGFAFITKVLPSIGKAIDMALATGQPFRCPDGLTTSKASVLPLLLGEPLRLVFDDSGELLPSAEARSVAGLRQLCLFFYKLELPYTHEDSKRVLNGFVERDESLSYYKDFDFSANPIYRRARGLISRVLGSVDIHNIMPRHGTGAVATREGVLEKSKFSRIYATAESTYPFAEYFRFSLTHTCDTIDEIQNLELLDEPMARVALVPKDSRGPRIISMEPLEIQWLQQGLMTPVVRAIEKHKLTQGHVNFRDQSVNRLLAIEGSISDEHVTLDMKEASDSVSLPLVRYLFGGTQLLEGLLATRSSGTLLPDGRVVTMNKFAPMGSALCFPVESIVFWAISCSVLWTAFGYSLKEAANQVYVYGDDLIVPKAHWSTIVQYLSNVGLEINPAKCCVSVGFRESCGMDAFYGVEVTPLRVKTRLTGALHTWLPAYVEISNLAESKGLYRVAQTIEHAIAYRLEKSGLSKGLIPYTDEPCGVLSYVRPYCSPKYNKMMGVKYRYRKEPKTKHNYQQLEVLGLQVQTRKLKPTLSGYDELLRCWHNYYDLRYPYNGLTGAGNLFADAFQAAFTADFVEALEHSQAMINLTESIKDEVWMAWSEVHMGTTMTLTNSKLEDCEGYTLLMASLASAQATRTLEWDPRNCMSARGNTYVDKRSLRLRKVWSPIR